VKAAARPNIAANRIIFFIFESPVELVMAPSAVFWMNLLNWGSFNQPQIVQ
jgi:hypothetical protein